MSAQPHEAPDHPPAEADRIDTWRITVVGVAAVVIFALASAATVAFMYWHRAELNPGFPLLPSQAGQRKIGIVEQQLFENMNRAEAMRRRQLERLGSYGWVDRQKGVVHIPVDRAMDLTLQGERP